MALLFLTVPDGLYPKFAENIQNVTATIGRDALLSCVVDNLRNYKVNDIYIFGIVPITFHFFKLKKVILK